MRRYSALVIAGVVLAASAAVVVPSQARSATPDCTYTPVLPKRIVVNKAPDAFYTPVKITGTDCTHNFGASVELGHRGDTYELSWEYNSRTSTDSIYPVTVKPGTYTTMASTATCSTTGSDGSTLSCAVGKGSTVIKFGGKVHLSADRLKGSDKDKVQFTVKATHYYQYTTKYLSTTVRIQRKDSGVWHTIHRDTTNGKRGYTWTYSDKGSDTYRAVFSETSTTFGAVSGTVTQ